MTHAAAPPAGAALTLRPAEPRDASAVAALIVQLWRAELPGLLRGGEAATARFLERHLLAERGARLGGLLVGEAGGEVVALGGLATRTDPRPPVGRPGMARDLVDCFGRAGTVLLLPAVVRNALSRIAEDEPGVGYIHSVVVGRDACARGHGRAMVARLESDARAAGCTAAVVQVIAGNPALAFWRALGYEPAGRYPRRPLARRLGIASELLRRELAA